MSGGGPGEPERIGSVIRDNQGNVLDNGSDANVPIQKSKTPRGLLKIQPGNYPKTLKFNKSPKEEANIPQPEQPEVPDMPEVDLPEGNEPELREVVWDIRCLQQIQGTTIEGNRLRRSKSFSKIEGNF